MGLRIRKSIKIAPGVRLNFGKKGISTSIGKRGVGVTFGPTGATTHISIPGTGISYVEKIGTCKNKQKDTSDNTISKPNGTTNNNKIVYEDCMEIVSKLKFNSDSDLFALERDKGLKAIIGNIYQSFDGKDLYPTIEEKAANFLYLITKNHTFIDGNKRIAATLFIYFLEFYNLLYNDNGQVIDNNTLVAITLLIAQSNPKEKDVLIDLVMNFLRNDN